MLVSWAPSHHPPFEEALGEAGRETALAPRKLRLPPGMANLPRAPYIGSPGAGLERRMRYRGPERADVAQLVEHQLPKLRVAGSIPVVRS
jgi:hypothetical protein